jgi:hypothetical protein
VRVAGAGSREAQLAHHAPGRLNVLRITRISSRALFRSTKELIDLGQMPLDRTVAEHKIVWRQIRIDGTPANTSADNRPPMELQYDTGVVGGIAGGVACSLLLIGAVRLRVAPSTLSAVVSRCVRSAECAAASVAVQ